MFCFFNILDKSLPPAIKDEPNSNELQGVGNDILDKPRTPIVSDNSILIELQPPVNDILSTLDENSEQNNSDTSIFKDKNGISLKQFNSIFKFIFFLIY